MDAVATTEIREVSVAEGYALIRDLLSQHYDEVAKFKDLFAIKPDLTLYEVFEVGGRLIWLVAIRGSVVAGYCVGVIKHSPHYKGTKFYANDVVYVAPAFRGTRLFLKLRAKTLEIAKTRGARLATWHTKQDSPMDKLMPRLGCQVLDVVWAERL